MQKEFFTEEKAKEITKDFCGNPPVKERVEYHLWLIRWKLDCAEKRTYCTYMTLKEQNDEKVFFKKMISEGERLMKEVENA